MGESFANLGICLGLGLLVGLQRQSTANELGGLRTFPLVTILGALCAMLAPGVGGWIVPAGLLTIAMAMATGNVARMRAGQVDPGITTEIALLLMFVIGAYVVHGHRPVAVAVGGGTAVLLHFKAELHDVVHRLDRDDLRAIMRFALIALVVLPVLPDDAIGPYSVFNPRQTWLMVVLIVGLSLAGYIASKFFGEKAGVLAGGVFGGIISSTATTVSWSRRTRQAPASSRAAAVVIVIASTVVYARVLVEISAIAPSLLRAAAPPVLVLAAAMGAAAFALWLRARGRKAEAAEGGDPTDLKAALTFAALYVLVLLAVAFVKDRLGIRGLYVLSVVSGLTDVDAITLSVSRLAGSGQLAPSQAWRLIVVAVLSNLCFKAAIASVLGDARLWRSILLAFAAQLAVGGLVIALWPA